MNAPVIGSEFSGAGMLDYGLHLAGFDHAWFAEQDEFRRGLLAQRWPGALILDDVRAVTADAVPRVDGIVGGFPCKGASTAGKRNGFDHAETVLWREMARAIRELEPAFVLVENVANILGLHDGAVWGEVVGDLAAGGFDLVWDCIPAAAVGAPHLRDRVLAVATHPDRFARLAEQLRDANWVPGRPDAAGPRDAASDADGGGGRARRTELATGGERAGRAGHGRGATSSPDPDGDAVREQPKPERRRGGSALAGQPGSAPADANVERRAPAATGEIEREVPAVARGEGRGVAVDWGVYGPAITRWEAIHGPAPEPLVRGVDDGHTLRLDRSRLRAIGDGVHVQVGYVAGCYILDRLRGVSV